MISRIMEMELIQMLGIDTFTDVAMTVTIATVSLMSLGVYVLFPEVILQLYFKAAVLWSGMKVRFVSPDDKFFYCYGEKGQQREGSTSILLLHGFSADHFMWTPVVQLIPSSVHVVAMDAPGHGGSSALEEDDDLRYEHQVKRIRQFVELSGLDKQPFHIVGLSMGGALAGLFAAEYPHLVKKIVLSCPSMVTPVPSQFAKDVRSLLESGSDMEVDSCILLPQNAAEMQEMLGLSCFYKTYAPNQMLQAAAEMRKRKNDFYLKLLRCLTVHRTALEDDLSRIVAPVQLIWGQNDQIIDLSGMEALKAGLANVERTDVIPDCGHAITLDQPKKYTQVIMDFLSDKETPES